MSDFPQTPRAAAPGAPDPPRMLPGMRGFTVSESVMAAAGRIPTINAEAFVREAEGGAKIGAGLDSLGGKLGEIARLQAEMRERNDELEARNARKEYERDILREATADPDERTWPGRVRKRTTQARTEWMKDRKYSPTSHAVVDRGFREWEGHMVAETTVSSAQRTRDNYAANLNKDYIEAVDAGDLKRAHAVVDEMVSGGVIPADAGAKRKIEARDQVERRTKEKEYEAKQTARSGDLDRYARALEKNPWEARDMLEVKDKEGRHTNFPAMDAADRLRARANAEDQIFRTQMKEVYGKGGMLWQIIGGTLDQAAIEKKAGELRLNPDLMRSLGYLRGRHAERKASRTRVDADELLRLTEDIERYKGDRESDPGAERWGDLKMRVEILTAGEREGEGSLRETLWEKLRPLQPGGAQPVDGKLPDHLEAQLGHQMTAERKLGLFKSPLATVTGQGGNGEDENTPSYLYGRALAAVENANYLREYAKAREDLGREWEAQPEKFLDPQSVERWMANRNMGRHAGLMVDWLRMSTVSGTAQPPPLGGKYLPPGPARPAEPGYPSTEEFNKKIGK